MKITTDSGILLITKLSKNTLHSLHDFEKSLSTYGKVSEITDEADSDPKDPTVSFSITPGEGKSIEFIQRSLLEWETTFDEAFRA